LVLSVYALFSCLQTREQDVPYLPKLAWVVLIVFVPFVGPIVWLLVARTTGTAQRERPRPATTPSRPVAPDDDPDFLASLERYRDPRTTVRPPTPGDAPRPEDKPAAADEPPAKDETASDRAARDNAVRDKAAKDKAAKDNAAKDKKAKDKKARDTESGAPTESDDGKP
jgi:type IV secretory pathway VirB10-like protein